MILDGAIIAAIGQVVAEGVLSLVRHASNVRDRRQSENLVVAVDDSIEEAMRRMQSLMTAGKTAEITAHSASDLARFMRSPEAVQSLEALLGIMLSGGRTNSPD